MLDLVSHALDSAFAPPINPPLCTLLHPLTPAVHELSHVGRGHYVTTAQKISDLASNGYDDGHDKVRKRRHQPHLGEQVNGRSHQV